VRICYTREDGARVRNISSPKVKVPNLGEDPGQLMMTMEAALRTLVATIQRDQSQNDPRDCVTHVLFDRSSTYPRGIPEVLLAHGEIQPVAAGLVGTESTRYCPDGLSAMLCMLALEKR
jgi:hypothetical protein